MSRVPPADVVGNSYFRVLGHRPGAARAWAALDKENRFGGTLEPELKEQVRRAMASSMGCAFCRTLGGGPRPDVDPRTSLAIAYGMQIASAHDEMDDSFFVVLREDFTDAEIVELTMWCCCVVAGQMFGAVMQIPEADADDQAMFATGLAQAEAERGPARAAS